MSVDARITQGETVKTSFWRSVEDGEVLKQLIAPCDVLVMGRTTYEVVHPKTSDKRLIIVLTTNPETYADRTVPGQLEFVSSPPAQLVEWLASRNYQKVLLLGGSSNIAFIKTGMVDDLYLTIEPSIFGQGKLLVDELPRAVSLMLRESKQLNRQGTLLLHYDVLKPNTIQAGQ